MPKHEQQRLFELKPTEPQKLLRVLEYQIAKELENMSDEDLSWEMNKWMNREFDA